MTSRLLLWYRVSGLLCKCDPVYKWTFLCSGSLYFNPFGAIGDFSWLESNIDTIYSAPKGLKTRKSWSRQKWSEFWNIDFLPICNHWSSNKWSYFWVGLISGVVLFLGWSYFWGGLISGVVLFLRWSYFWGVLFLGWSYFWDGFISRVVLRLGSLYLWPDPGTNIIVPLHGSPLYTLKNFPRLGKK